MRRIAVDLPDWADGRYIYVLAGIELAAYQRVGGPMMVKTGRCSMCGKCCKDCSELEPDGEKLVCGLALGRPFSCCVGVGFEIDGCTEKFEEYPKSRLHLRIWRRLRHVWKVLTERFEEWRNTRQY